MRNTKTYSGTWTALVTPFTTFGTIDWLAFAKLIQYQIQAGVTGVLINGTTGESPTIEMEELLEMTTFAKKYTYGHCLLMVGTGTNSTQKSIHLSKLSQNAGADLLLLVNPYYNKPTQPGLYSHFSAIAKEVTLPIFLYNIKSRTAINLETPTLQKLVAEMPNIVGVKEASGDLDQINQVIKNLPINFTVLSGDDNIAIKIIRDFGAQGVISVVSNIAPRQIVTMINSALNKDFATAEKIDQTLRPIFAGAFMETNPIPIKAALAMSGKIQEIYRLPMCPMSAEKRMAWNTLLKLNSLL